MRPGLQGDWDTAHRAFDELSYDNRIGVAARADRLADLTALLAEHRLSVHAWYGVRVFTDTTPSDAPRPGSAQLAEILAVSNEPGRPIHIGAWQPSRM
jgi:S-adenosylmethionine-dependent methyltransferase